MRREDTLSNSRTSRTLHRVVGTCAFATGFGARYLLGGEDPRADLPAPFGTAARSYGRWWPPRWPSWPSRVGCMSGLAVGAIVGSLCLV